MPTISGFNSRLSSGGIIGNTNCDIDDLEGLRETLGTYLKTDTFRSNASKVLTAHSIDPSTVKAFQVEILKDGGVYLILPTSGRKFKLSDDATIASAAFAKATMHPTKSRADLVKPFTSMCHPRSRADDREVAKVKKEDEPVPSSPRPISPAPPYSPGSFAQQPPSFFPGPQYPSFFPGSPYAGPQYPQAFYHQGYSPMNPAIQGEDIIGYKQSPSGSLVPIYGQQGFAHTFSSSQTVKPPESVNAAPRPVVEEFSRSEGTIHADVQVETPPLTKHSAPMKEFARSLDHTAALLKERGRSHALEDTVARTDLLRAADKATIEDYVSILETEHDKKSHILEQRVKELEGKQSTFSKVIAGLAGTHELEKEEIEYLEESIEGLQVELGEIEAKLHATYQFLDLPDTKRLDIIRREEQALRNKAHSLEKALAAKDAKYKKLGRELQQTRLQREVIKYEDVTVEKFLSHYASTSGRITYETFQSMLKQKLIAAENAIDAAEGMREEHQSELPFGLMEYISSSSQSNGELGRSLMDAQTQEIYKQNRIIKMLERLQKTTRSEFIESEEKACKSAH